MTIKNFLTYNCGKIVALRCWTGGINYIIHLYNNTLSTGCNIAETSISHLLMKLKSNIQFFYDKTIYIITDLIVDEKDTGDLINITMDFFYKHEIECLVGTYDDFKEYLEKGD